MCGIVGIYSTGGLLKKCNNQMFSNMLDALENRGPDDYGNYTDKNIFLGHRRLSIIDISENAHQPMANENKTIWIVCNGEIYNYRELRKDLVNKNHSFVSKSDTEVILHLYEEYGTDCLRYLSGMFSFALWDSVKKRLFLARDRFGIKPLHYYMGKDYFVFASEIKSILKCPFYEKELNPIALSEYLTYEYVPCPNTIYKGIYKLPPANYATITERGFDISKYWEINFVPNHSLSEDFISENLIQKLSQAVRLHLVSDVPLGVFLSGGLDSSTIVALASEEGKREINTFTVGFKESSYDETGFAEEVSKRYNTRHFTEFIDEDTIIKLVPDILGYLDEPLADASIFPTYLVSKFARQRVKVILSGDGGDELLGGYNTYQAFCLAQIARKFPLSILKTLEKLINLMPVSDRNLSPQFKAKKFLKGLNFPPEISNAIWWGAYSPFEKSELFTEDFKKTIDGYDEFKPIKEHLSQNYSEDILDRIFYLDLKMNLQDCLLVKVDRMSMACSLETRVPFLDHHFAEFTMSIPSNLKINRMRTKYIFRKSMKGILPQKILGRSKKGFDIPLTKWLRSGLKEFAMDCLNSSAFRNCGIFNNRTIENILDNHFKKRRDNRQLIWPLVVFSFWKDNYYDP